ncbi:MFS transporter [Gynuella sunshinyii]|uniref:Arabinose efflux permease n=1 Tax=Gynuella sunshinyii YC6258 TaxID=1445510 RepID=A0A0C5VGV3_9GAMM|nr:MFS transporter [Gynuella sunshinyii]AJQ93451.1 arabinose efflux permease [Gynuella sunshinyii YC6258]
MTQKPLTNTLENKLTPEPSVVTGERIRTGTPAYWRATLALCLGSFMIFSNLYVTQPLLPMLASNFHISALSANWSFTIATLTLGLSLLFYGPLSDVFGRRGIMVVTMAGAILTTLLISQVHSYEWLLILRALQGLCLGGLPAIAVAYMGDEFDSHALITAVGFYIGANSLGGISGRLIGGFAGEHLGWSSTFMVIALISLVIWAGFIYLLPASSHFQARPFHPRQMFANLLEHLRNPMLLPAYLIGGFNFFVFINQYSYLTFVLEKAPYSLSTQVLGMLFLTYLTGTFGSTLAGRASRYLAQPLCMALGIVILMTGSLITLIPALPMIIVGLLINSLGFFFAHATASSWVSRNAHHARASASSLYLVFYYLGASTGGIYLHPFWRWQGWNGVIAGSLLILAGTLSTALFLYHRSRRASAAS